MFRRSDSSASISSSDTDPPENLEEDEIMHLESYQHIDIDEYDIEDYSIPIEPELDFSRQSYHRTINFSINQPKYKSPLEYWKFSFKKSLPKTEEWTPLNRLEGA